MSDSNGFVARIKSLPVLLPMVGVFQLVMFLLTVTTFVQLGEFGSTAGIGTSLRWLVYAGLWAAICIAQRRWIVILYMLLSGAELLGYYVGPPDGILHVVASDAMELLNVLLCFFLLVFFKRFH